MEVANSLGPSSTVQSDMFQTALCSTPHGLQSTGSFIAWSTLGMARGCAALGQHRELGRDLCIPGLFANSLKRLLSLISDILLLPDLCSSLSELTHKEF